MSFWLDIVDIQDKLMGVANSAPPVFMDFVACWMAKISEYDRKAYSHLGYVNKFAGSPVHWQHPAGGGGGFDPGNLLYARAVHLATNLPVTQLFSWNDETLGDVMEGMLAYFAVRRAVSVYHADMGDWLNLLGKIVWEASRDTNDWSSPPLVWLARLGLSPSLPRSTLSPCRTLTVVRSLGALGPAPRNGMAPGNQVLVRDPRHASDSGDNAVCLAVARDHRARWVRFNHCFLEEF